MGTKTYYSQKNLFKTTKWIKAKLNLAHHAGW
jgi:hypothetical protein